MYPDLWASSNPAVTNSLKLQSVSVPEVSQFGYSVDEIKRSQSDDPELSVLMQWLIQEPSEDALFLAGPTLKYYWSLREQLVLKDGILYYRWEAPHGEQ